MPLKLFISYAHVDDAHRAALVEHLTPLIDAGVFTLWHDRRLTGGQDWAGQIDQHLAAADIVLLLVSRHFLASEYCKGVEVAQALAAETAGQLRVIPVVLKSCAWTDAPIGRLQALPHDGLPIVESPYPDRLYQQVVEGLKQVAFDLRPALLDQKVPAPIPPGAGTIVPPHPPWYRQTVWRVAVASLVVLLLAGVLFAWRMAALRAAVDDDLRIDRPDLALERLEPMPAWLDAWPGLRLLRVAAQLHDASRKAGTDSARLERELAALLKLQPGNAHLLFARARRAYLQGGDEGVDGARKALQTVLAADPTYAAAQSYLGLLADRVGEVDVAAGHHAQALALAPTVPQYQLNQARSLLDLGRTGEARSAYARVDGSYALAPVEAALASWALAKPAEAEAQQSRALQLLGNAEVMAQYANRSDWVFLYPDPDDPGTMSEQVLAGAARRCYVEMELSISGALAERATPAAGPLAWPASCTDRAVNKQIAQLVAADLCRYVIQAGEVTAPWVEIAQTWRTKLGMKAGCAPLLRGRVAPQT
ncbi:MAG TPA: TIR domain-containing protein [Burkholderiaceae bacterium]|nr:TIR domain-containing protein [Burkholderiaceae bacterium]